MTKEQRLFKGIILADLKIVSDYFNDPDKAMRQLAAYHMQQAVEKTIKLKAEIEGLNLWGHDIRALIKRCDDNGIDIGIPKMIREKEKMITGWEADCRYYPIKGARKDSVKKIYDVLYEWLEDGNTASKRRKVK